MARPGFRRHGVGGPGRAGRGGGPRSSPTSSTSIPLAVEDALSVLQFPKIESYKDYLYLVLHGIDVKKGGNRFATHDVDFFLGPNYLVTVHDGHSRSITALRAVCDRSARILAEGPVGLMHRIVDTMVDNYRPVMEEFEKRMTRLEEEAFNAQESLVRQVIRLKRGSRRHAPCADPAARRHRPARQARISADLGRDGLPVP